MKRKEAQDRGRANALCTSALTVTVLPTPSFAVDLGGVVEPIRARDLVRSRMSSTCRFVVSNPATATEATQLRCRGDLNDLVEADELKDAADDALSNHYDLHARLH